MTQQQPPQRKLSCFFSRELFSLYIEEKLDAIRVGQVNDHLSGCDQCPPLLLKMKKSKKTLGELSDLKVSKEMIDYLKKEHYFWSEFAENITWNNWHPTMQWASQLATVAVSLALVVHFFPWRNVAQKIKHMQPVTQTQMVADSSPAHKPEITDALEKPAALIPIKALPEPPKVVAKNELKTKENKKPPIPVAVAEEEEEDTEPTDSLPQAPPPIANAEPAKPMALPEPPPTPAENISNEDETTDAKVVSKETSQKYKGFVWRGSLKVDELSDELSDRVTKAIVDLGGTKAGQVELGWRRSKERYYHFIFPEESYEKLLSELNQDGIVQLTKERHPRIIKSGYMRIIMTLEESK